MVAAEPLSRDAVGRREVVLEEALQKIANAQAIQGSMVTVREGRTEVVDAQAVARVALGFQRRKGGVLVEEVNSVKEEALPLRLEIENAINRASRENRSDTPDYILAEYLMSCLDAFGKATNKRRGWLSPDAQSARTEGEGLCPMEKRELESKVKELEEAIRRAPELYNLASERWGDADVVLEEMLAVLSPDTQA
jgi:hypothetical protein